MDGSYEPDWTNGHVQKRLKKVLQWAAQYTIGKHGSVVPLHLSAKGFDTPNGRVPGLNDIFGPKGNALGDYLRERLLCTSSRSYTPGKSSRTYTIQADVFSELSTKLKTSGDASPPTQASSTDASSASLQVLIERHAEELHSGVFEYRDSSNRLWHPLQNLPRAAKGSFWQRFGLPYDYDIQACAPTILLQLAQRADVPAVLVEPLQGFLEDREGFRAHVATLTGLSIPEAKGLINSLFNGAKLGANSRFSSFQTLGYRTEAMEALKSDRRVKDLLRSIRIVWKQIEGARRLESLPTMEQVLAGVKRRDFRLQTARKKWNLYFQYERQVLDAIRQFAQDRQITIFSEHDGFRASREVDLAELQSFIETRTGFRLQFERKS